jgi:hypothetical protein
VWIYYTNYYLPAVDHELHELPGGLRVFISKQFLILGERLNNLGVPKSGKIFVNFVTTFVPMCLNNLSQSTRRKFTQRHKEMLELQTLNFFPPSSRLKVELTSGQVTTWVTIIQHLKKIPTFGVSNLIREYDQFFW